MFFTIFHLAKFKNYNLNVTEVRDSDFKNAFPGIFNLTVGILLLNKNRCLGLFQISTIVSHQTNFSAQKKEFEAEKAKKRKARAKSASPKKARK